MKKLLPFLILMSASAFAGPEAIVPGNSFRGAVYLFDEAAKRMYQILQDSGVQKLDVFGCTELRSRTVVCAQLDPNGNAYTCAISVAKGEVVKDNLSVCPRP